MIRSDLIKRVRSLTRDFSNSIFRQEDIVNYINEAIDRFVQTIPEMSTLGYLLVDSTEPLLIPKQYQHLLSVYSASRCFGQDERHYQATSFMNEFENKLDELKIKLEIGEIKLINPVTGLAVVRGSLATDYVVDNYFYNGRSKHVDLDTGVGGVVG